jgi:hypothetical protein
VVKIDVEGHEADVLAGLAPLVDEGVRPAVVVEVHRVFAVDAPTAAAAFCERYGYGARLVSDDEGQEYELAPRDRRPEVVDVTPDQIRENEAGRFILVLEPGQRRSTR